MKSRFARIFATFALTITLCAYALSAASPAQASAVEPDQQSAADARKLKLAETKLAALVKEAKAESAPPEAEAQKAAVKKKPGTVGKKRVKKTRSKLHAKGASTGKAGNIVNRRLTLSEVQGILSTTRDFSGSDLSGMNLVGVDLRGVKLNRANLQMANLERADLAESDLELADLTGANLRSASLNQARLRGTRLERTRMDGAMWIDKTICKKGSVGSCIE